MYCRMNRVECPYADMNGYCDSTACHNMNVVGNIIPKERPDNINIGNSSIWVKPQGNWHKGEPTRTDCLYLVLWFDTEDKTYQYSVLHWHNQLHCWFDEETPSCLWGDEWKAKVVAWLPFEPYKED